MSIIAQISPSPLRLDPCYAAIRDDRCGGLAFFVGDVRNRNEGHDVEALEFTSYVPMAEQEMRKIAEGVLRETDAQKLYVAHRVGTLAIGDTAVIIGAAAVHRDAAFRACRLMIDRLKETVPIWKKEISPDGNFWINAHP